ncbi:MAG: Holliday junction resolvase RuvX [Kiritimatiellae bacterium]|nr:Holliday junction resolvase RuvX [Kiritimatiellia bacterium]
MNRILGVDFGDRRTGLAASDPTNTIAFPRETLECPNLQQAAAAVARAADALPAALIVVGWPLNMDGSPGPRTARTQAFIDDLSARTPVPIVRWDERLSSKVAETALLEANVSRTKRRAVIDKLAAQVILQSYLDAHPS